MQRNPSFHTFGQPRYFSGARLWLVVQILIFSIALIARVLPGPRTIDDSFITYRYARNILAGNGFVYNPGEHVLGTTTPLYTILLVTSGALSGGTQAPFPAISLLVNALADAFTCLLLLRIGRYLGSPWAGTGAALAWAVAPYSVTFAIGGLETSLYVLLLTATVASYIEKRYRLAWLAGAFSLLTRPDALILLGPLALDRFIRALREMRDGHSSTVIRTIAWEAAVFLFPVSIWVIFSSIYFGSPLPHSIAAKALAYRLQPTEALVRLLQHYATPFLEHLTFGIPWIGLGFVLYFFLCIIAGIYAFRHNSRTWPMAAYPWLYFLTFASANPLIFRWYMTPPLPFYFLMILVGAEQLLSRIIKRKSVKTQKDHGKADFLYVGLAAIILVLAPSLLNLQDWRLHPDHGPDRPAPHMAYIQLELYYQEAAEWLVEEFTKEESIPHLAAGDVGVLGFVTDAHILDTVGLNTPVSSQYYPLDPALYVINYAIPPDLILNESPDYLVILEVYGRIGLLKDPRFIESYQLRRKIATDMYGSDGMLIFQKIP